MSLYFVVDRESGPTAAGSMMIWRYSYTSTGQFYITVVLHLAFAHHVRATAHTCILMKTWLKTRQSMYTVKSVVKKLWSELKANQNNHLPYKIKFRV